jgi:hypothetical protein
MNSYRWYFEFGFQTANTESTTGLPTVESKLNEEPQGESYGPL